MIVTLYQPGVPPQEVPATGFATNAKSGEIRQNQARAAELLACAPGMVDVLASGAGYLVYSVFDHDGVVNFEAMAAFARLTGVELEATDDDEVLRGPVLAIRS